MAEFQANFSQYLAVLRNFFFLSFILLLATYKQILKTVQRSETDSHIQFDTLEDTSIPHYHLYEAGRTKEILEILVVCFFLFFFLIKKKPSFFQNIKTLTMT